MSALRAALVIARGSRSVNTDELDLAAGTDDSRRQEIAQSRRTPCVSWCNSDRVGTARAQTVRAQTKGKQCIWQAR